MKQNVAEIIVCDCSGGKLKTKHPVDIVTFSRDYGNKVRHAVSTLTKSEYVLQADDDLVPHEGFVDDFLKYKDLEGISGVIGRKFIGPDYYKDTQFFKSSSVQSPVEVDFCGVVYFCKREYLAMDLDGMQNPINDLFWCCEKYPDVKKWVIPTNKYNNLPTCSDEECLFKNPEARKLRQEYYGQLYSKIYSSRNQKKS